MTAAMLDKQMLAVVVEAAALLREVEGAFTKNNAFNWDSLVPMAEKLDALRAASASPVPVSDEARDAALWRWFRDHVWVGTDEDGVVNFGISVGEPEEIECLTDAERTMFDNDSPDPEDMPSLCQRLAEEAASRHLSPEPTATEQDAPITDAERLDAICRTVAATTDGVVIHDATPDWSVVVMNDGEVCGQGEDVRSALDPMVREDRLVKKIVAETRSHSGGPDAP